MTSSSLLATMLKNAVSSSRPITGTTRLAGVIGDPVRHSLSPAINNAAFAALGLDWVYVALPTPPADAGVAIAAMRSFDIGGLSVTTPHKRDVIAYLDDVTPSARTLNAVNCVYWQDGLIVGDNTDGAGCIAGIRADLDFDVAGRSVAVVGAGGAARAVIAALAAASAGSVGVINRTASSAAAAAELAGAVGSIGDETTIRDAELVINATSVGLAGGPEGAMAFDPSLLSVGQHVVDLIYHPLTTPLLAAAGQRGARTANGVSMLLHQAAIAVQLWTGQPAPIAKMRAAIDRELENRPG